MFEALKDLDPTWLLFGALTFLPLAFGLLGFVLSVISRHKMRAIVSIAVLMVMTGGAVMAYESEHDGDIPSNIEEVKRVPESVENVIRNVMGNITDDDIAQGQLAQGSASTSTPTPTLTSTPTPRQRQCLLRRSMRMLPIPQVANASAHMKTILTPTATVRETTLSGRCAQW